MSGILFSKSKRCHLKWTYRRNKPAWMWPEALSNQDNPPLLSSHKAIFANRIISVNSHLGKVQNSYDLSWIWGKKAHSKALYWVRNCSLHCLLLKTKALRKWSWMSPNQYPRDIPRAAHSQADTGNRGPFCTPCIIKPTYMLGMRLSWEQVLSVMGDRGKRSWKESKPTVRRRTSRKLQEGNWAWDFSHFLLLLFLFNSKILK
jgi:hypothetical protein